MNTRKDFSRSWHALELCVRFERGSRHVVPSKCPVLSHSCVRSHSLSTVLASVLKPTTVPVKQFTTKLCLPRQMRTEFPMALVSSVYGTINMRN